MNQGVPSSGAARNAAPPVAAGDILAGKYRVERVLGMGGMGVVVAATHIDLLERRAIKFMLPSQLGDAEAVERFLREARASSRLKGEHVAKVHDVGRLDNGAPYMVMEYLTGGDLRVMLKKRGAIPPHEAALYVLQACEALAEAHGSGIVHRDVKPENLFLTRRPDGTPSIKVLDFGISKMMGTDLGITGTQAILGSPYYMSPEQLRASRDVDPRTDIWSLGIILYQLVTNNLPFQGQNLTALISAVIVGQYSRASEIKLGLSGALDPVIDRCLQRDLARRYATVADLAEALLPIAPPAASESVERIFRLLRPNSVSPSDRILLRSYDAPGPPGADAAGVADGVGIPDAGAPATTTDRSTTDRSVSGPVLTSRAAPHTTNPLGRSGPVTDPITDPGGSTLRSSDPSAAGDATSGSWGAGVPSVRVVVQPARTPVLILAAGVALALVIAAVALLLGRASSRRADVVIVAASTTPGTAPPNPGPPPTVTAAPSTTVAAADPRPPAPPTATPTGSAHHSVAMGETPKPPAQPPGKLPPRAGATSDPAKPPSAGDPFGEGRQ